jgi:small multidrug resistance family-3 protein
MRIVRIKAVPADRVYGRPVLGRASRPQLCRSLTRADTALAGRAYAAYGGIYIAASLMWLWLVEGEPPTKTDMFGAGLAIIGALVIIGLAPRAR